MSAQGLRDRFAPLEASEQVQHRKPSHCATTELFLELGEPYGVGASAVRRLWQRADLGEQGDCVGDSHSAITTRPAAGRAIAIAWLRNSATLVRECCFGGIEEAA